PTLDLKLNLSPTRSAAEEEEEEEEDEEEEKSPTVSPASTLTSCLSEEYSSPETAPSMILAGCPRCLMYVMLSEKDRKCPKCKTAGLLDVVS
ncbi:hypothetical protein M569_02650, partial [Genlisea aurea]